jgi:hypothetical protein
MRHLLLSPRQATLKNFKPISANEVKAEQSKNLTRQKVYQIRKEFCFARPVELAVEDLFPRGDDIPSEFRSTNEGTSV